MRIEEQYKINLGKHEIITSINNPNTNNVEVKNRKNMLEFMNN